MTDFVSGFAVHVLDALHGVAGHLKTCELRTHIIIAGRENDEPSDDLSDAFTDFVRLLLSVDEYVYEVQESLAKCTCHYLLHAPDPLKK